jgi:hypothetical protein
MSACVYRYGGSFQVRFELRAAAAGRCAAYRPQSVLQEIIIALSKLCFLRNPFDCVSPRAVRSVRWVSGFIGMLEAFTAFFGVMSAGIFIAHAVDGYRSRPQSR